MILIQYNSALYLQSNFPNLSFLKPNAFDIILALTRKRNQFECLIVMSVAGDVDVLQHTLAKYLVEIALPEYTLAHIPPSLLASAALYLSLMIQEPGASLSSVWSPTLQYYSTYRPDDILPVVSSLASVLAKRGETKLRAVHTKYSSRKFMKVADMPELAGEMVGKLARMKPTQL